MGKECPLTDTTATPECMLDVRLVFLLKQDEAEKDLAGIHR